MRRTVAEATDSAPAADRLGMHRTWNPELLYPIEGSFHPYGLNVLKQGEGTGSGRLRSPNDEQQSGDPDPHHRRAQGASGGA
ncbi:hypothetical protein GCM10010378_64470 [Streptomyces viridochromogenes]